MSNIIAGGKSKKKVDDCKVVVNVDEKSKGNSMGCECNHSKVCVKDVDQVGKLVSDLVKGKKGARATFNIQIQFDA